MPRPSRPRSLPTNTSVSAGVPPLWRAITCVLLGCGLTAVSLQSVFSREFTATALVSPELWRATVELLGGHVISDADGTFVEGLGLGGLFGLCLVWGLSTWIAGAAWIARRQEESSFQQALIEWGQWGWIWWLLPGVWELSTLIAFIAGVSGIESFLLSVPNFLYAVQLAGWAATFLTLMAAGRAKTPENSAEPRDDFRIPATVWIVAGISAAVWTAMNWQLYRGLLIPHGDSAMYEEHLWNLLNGKGFRSYLDQGLFLGEHIQVIHLFLIPFYLLWPSHMLLELCESVALASGALPVFWLARRQTGSPIFGILLSSAYLLYFPLQFLDISIDLKTFRPIAFGVPLLLFALDQWERRRWRTALLLMLVTLSAKEDYALVLAPLGIWMAVCGIRPFSESQKSQNALQPDPKTARRLGTALAIGSAIYLLLAIRVLIPWFRAGDEVHYVSYFSKFGDSLGEVVWTMLTDPVLLGSELLTAKTALYALALLLPLGGIPLLAPARLSVAFPLFGILCLNEIAQDPRHHFHAPLIPILFWSAASGLGNIPHLWGRWIEAVKSHRTEERNRFTWPDAFTIHRWGGWFVLSSSLATGLFFSLSPLGLTFWDPGSAWHWRELYVPGKRAELFPRVLEQIPEDARVASTDFIHPRFTHHERSYDYSHYARKVSGYELRVPPDTDYIVIDTRHRYSEIGHPEQIRELREEPERWELLPDKTEGYFIILKRRH